MNELQLIADIGGTNTRFAVGQAGRFEHMRELRNVDHASFQDAAHRFLADLPKGMHISKGAVAVAGLASRGDVVKLTNYDWTFSIARTRDELGLSELRVFNDFEATAM